MAPRRTRRRDEGVKLKLYDREDVLEYWIVDADAETIRVYRRRSGPLVCVATLTREPHVSLTSPLLPGATLALDRIFAR
jgi:Uma2 family endonuclease